jgi:hypothetical protein
MMSQEYMRVLIAKEGFKINDDFEFIEFDDITGGSITEDRPTPDQVEIFAAVKIGYTGEVPDSYKTLNLIIGDWVEDNEDSVARVVNEALRKHFTEYYPNADLSEMEDGSPIWLDQLDYMPRINSAKKEIIIEVELVMDTEEC